MSIKRAFLFFILLLPGSVLFAQAPAGPGKTGTIKVRKAGTDKVLPVLQQKKKKSGKKLYSYTFVMNSFRYKVTFPKTYSSEVYPMIFNNSGLAISDADRQLTDDKPQTFSYELFVKNTFVTKKTGMNNFFFNQMLLQIRDNGSFVWVSEFSFRDRKGVIHTNEIPAFKVERIN